MPKYFVNRGGGRVPEGPFEEAQIVRLILAGKLKAGHVCQEGLQRFTPLEDHPPFKQALAQVGIVPAPEALSARARPAQGQRTSSSRGLLFGAVLAFFGLAIGAVAIGTYVMFNTGGMPVHAALPGDTELLFEVTSVRGTVGNLGVIRGLDTKRLALFEDACNALSASFGVPKARVSALLLAASSLGVGARNLSGAPEAGVLLTFSSATPVNTFLSSKRFVYSGLVATNGRKYKVLAGGSQAAAGAAAPSPLSSLSLDDSRMVLVWFETSKVLFLGSASFASDISRTLSLDAPSLELNPNFKKAQHEWLGKPEAIFYFDAGHLSETLGPPLKGMFDDSFKKAEPANATFSLVPAGVLTHAVARFIAQDRPPGTAAATVLPAAPLMLSERLPSETFAYVAAATNVGLSGDELRQALLAQIRKSDPGVADQVSAQLQRAEADLHLSFDQVLGSIGDQAAVALAAPTDFRIELGNPAQMAAHFAVISVQALKDEAPARALFAQLKTQFEQGHGPAHIQQDPSGYVAIPNDDELGVSLQLRFSKGYVCMAVGNAVLVERSVRAFSLGESTLSAEPAHSAARAALPSSAQAIIWVDAARIVNTLRESALFAPEIHELGLDRDVLRWIGPDRITTALALNGELREGIYTYRVDALNLPVFAGLWLSANHAAR